MYQHPRPGAAAGFSQGTVLVGGRSKAQLLAELVALGVEFNAAAHQLIADDRFTTSARRDALHAVVLTVRELGFGQGATWAQIIAAACALGLCAPPMELGLHLRLQWTDQPEGFWGHPSTQHRAPPGSVTVAARPWSEDEALPQGLYLRRIRGVLCLRGYRSGPAHVWDAEDHLLFTRPGPARISP